MDDLARKILNAIEGGDIEGVYEGGQYHVLIDLKPVLSFSSKPECGETPDHKVRIVCGITAVESIQADNVDDAESIADALNFCFATCRAHEPTDEH